MFDASVQVVFHEIDWQNDGVNFDGGRLLHHPKKMVRELAAKTATGSLRIDTSETKAMSKRELKSRIRVRDEHIKGESEFLYVRECVKARETTE
ncbi:unnamed protein product [Toxocara canis]|uniref:Phage protein n=1 Tax=Toxocara canis TaxID=6265 RepID=A0A183V2E3_TOXCA|nr:unnamed protein product [Toxocara canis]